jgi:hypothetical protein
MTSASIPSGLWPYFQLLARQGWIARTIYLPLMWRGRSPGSP